SQLLIATENYAAAHGVLPPGTIEAKGPIQSVPVGYHMGWLAQLLPYFEQGSVYDQIDFSVGAYHARNAAARDIGLSLLHCPSSTWTAGGGSSYAGCHHDVEAPIDADNHGVLFLNSAIGWNDLLDGRAQTILIGERFNLGPNLGWMSGTRSTLANTGTPINLTSRLGGPAFAVGISAEELPALDDPAQPRDDASRPVWQFQPQAPGQAPGGAAALVVGGFESMHPGGAQFGFGDGSVRFLSQDVDHLTYQRLGHRADGALLDERY
ncbi:MAG TPA: DUF1559 domain-containing protein, partial [Pirellulales bacterium]|nr:DUF1559 domain-containing protein [Pirellulales bacterium]